MKIKKYNAPSMREALLQIKQELGEDAIILKTRKLPKKMFALGGQEEIEVTAAIDEMENQSAVRPLKLETGIYSNQGRKPRSTEKTVPTPAMPEAVREPLSRRPHPPEFNRREENSTDNENFQLLELKEDLRKVRELVQSFIENPSPGTRSDGFSDGWADLYNKLVDADVRESTAREMIERIRNRHREIESLNEKALVTVLKEYVPVSGPIRLLNNKPLVITFVGPTGAGKTTTLAKLAAYLTVKKKKMVSLITADTYRIAAIEQIRTFADIVNIGLQVVFSPDEVVAALEACENDDVIFIDTAGRSQRNQEHMQELDTLLQKIKPDETHLVLSASTKNADLLEIVDRYRHLGVNRLLFTKLDETVSVGNILNTVHATEIPLSYFTTGQSIPDDIELAQPGRFIQKLLERRER